MILLASLALISAFLNTPADLKDGKCTACARWHVTSTVTMRGYAQCTVMACSLGHFDEQGVYRSSEPCNTCTAAGRCSRGHEVYSSWKQ